LVVASPVSFIHCRPSWSKGEHSLSPPL
jgi:hypothetical protein